MRRPIIDIKHLKYRYPKSKNWVINNLNLRIMPGEWLTLVGLNGSGKSTLVKLIDGLLPINSGDLLVNGLSFNNKNLLKIRSQIGIVFQNPKDQFVGVTVNDEIAFGLENRQIPANQIRQRILKALSLVGMSQYYNSLINNLSGGQQQRIAIADVIALSPRIIILDECTSMLDPEGRSKILHLINSLKRHLHLTVIDITHDVSDVKYAQKIAIMNKGQIVANGTPNKVFQKRKLFHECHLSLPDSDILRDLLSQRGVKVPDRNFNETEMLGWLHRLFFEK